ncbi:MAG: cyclic nucleotide-binding domain-containing protein [Anaerolineales bacterium]
MVTALAERAALLKDLALFGALNEEQIELIAGKLHEHKLPANGLLYGAGDRAENFYIVASGRLLNQDLHEGSRVGEYLLEPGDSFGAEALLNEGERLSAVSALRPSRLLYLTGKDFRWMLAEFPEVAASLQFMMAGRKLLGEVNLDFLGASEVVHYASRRHIGYLWFRLARAMLLAIVGLLVFSFAISTGGQLQFYFILGGAFLICFAGGWAVWEGLNWRNDLYLITNQRVVWLEQELLRSSSRIEAPLASIQSVNLQTSLMGRILGFGTVIVRTFTGTVQIPHVGFPVLAKALIEEYAGRTRKKDRETRHDSIRQAVRESLGEGANERGATSAPRPAMQMRERPNRFALFRTRTVQGDTVTYHKHWFTLVRGLTLPALIALAVLIGRPYLLGLPASGLGWLITLAAFITPVLLMGYRILDWQNDVYVVTPEALIDSEKKPLGSEVIKSAPLANVLSLENHKVGLLGLLLNYGVVRVNIGDTSLDFANVANPAQVQQDIFARMEALKLTHERSAADEERRRMTEWLRVYEEERGAGNGAAENEQAVE